MKTSKFPIKVSGLVSTSLLCLGLLMGSGSRASAQDTTTGLLGHWQFEEGIGTTTADVAGTNTGTLLTSPLPVWATSQTGLGSALQFSGVGGTGGRVSVGNPLELQLTGPLTLSAWTYQDTLGNNGRIVTKQGNTPNRGWSLGVEPANFYSFQIATSGSGLAYVNTANGTVLSNVWTHVAGVYDNVAQTLKIYINGTEVPTTAPGSAAVPASMYNPSLPVTIGNRNQATWTPYYGMLDEVRIYNRALSAADIAALAVIPEPSTPAGFGVEPVSQSVPENQPVTFNVSVTGTPPISVQWQRNSNNIADATNLNYSIPAASLADHGAAFRVVAINDYGQAISSNAILTVVSDVVPPSVLAVTPGSWAMHLTNLTVKFSEPVGAGTAELTSNYVLSGGLQTYLAVLQPDLTTVLLTIDPLTIGASYTLSLSGVRDRAAALNLMAPTNWAFVGPPLHLAPLIQVRFEEGTGTTAANQGTAGGALTLSATVPAWTNNVPAGLGSASSVDFGTNTGNYYVESPTNYPQLADLTKFTIAGWVNNRDSTMGNGGNRIVTWINNGGNGVDLVYWNDGSLRLGINQWPNYGINSSPAMITTDENAGADNWRFFAVTYDSTLASEHVKFYFGDNVTDATLNVALDYPVGAVGANISRLCIGHFNIATRASATWNRMFRGLIDEVQIFNDAFPLEEIQHIKASIPPAPLLTAVKDGNQIVLSWTSPGSFQLQYRGDVAQGIWNDETTPPVVIGDTSTVTVPITGPTRFYRLKSL
jgi:hypothetical protein